MKLRLETNHSIKLHAKPENGDGYEVSLFVKPHIAIDCPVLWEWLKAKVNIRESYAEGDDDE